MDKTSDAAPADKSSDKAAQAVGPFVLASFTRLQEAIGTDQGPVEIALRLKEHEEAIQRACEAEKARHPLRAVDADASLEARAKGALRAWRNNGSISDVADLRSWIAVVLDVDASRPALSERVECPAVVRVCAEVTADGVDILPPPSGDIPPEMTTDRSGLTVEEARAIAPTEAEDTAWKAGVKWGKESRPGLTRDQAAKITTSLNLDVGPDFGRFMVVQEKVTEALMRVSRGEFPESVRGVASAKRPAPPPYTGPWPLCIDCVTEPGVPPYRLFPGQQLPGLDMVCAKCGAGGYVYVPKDAPQPTAAQRCPTCRGSGAGPDCPACGSGFTGAGDVCGECGGQGATEPCPDCDGSKVRAAVAEAKADPLAGLPEEERQRIRALAEKAQGEVGMRSTAPWAGRRAYEATIEREVAAYRARQVPETLTREEAEQRLRALDLSDKVLGRCLDVPRDVLNEIGWGTGDQVKGARVAVILRAYVRGLDAQGAAS